MTRSLPMLLALTVAACASHSTTPGTGPAPATSKQPPPATRANLVTLAPGTSRYLLHQHVHIQQDFTGLPPSVDIGYALYLSTSIADTADSIGYPTSFTIDSVTVDSGSQIPPQIDLAGARGLTISGRLSRTGEFLDPMPSDSGVAASLGNLMPRFRNFFPRLPEGGVAPAMSWTDTTQTTDSSAATTVSTTSINHRSATTWEQHDGVRALRLDITATFQFKGSGEQSGSPFTLAGSGTASGVQFLAANGRYLGGESSDSTSLTIDLPAQGYSIPRQQLARTRVTALP
jgi:hypothetical protein